MSIFDKFSNSEFIDIITSSQSWKEIGEKFGYANTLSSNTKAQIIAKCNDLGIEAPKIKKAIPVEEQTKGNLFSNRRNWQSARTAIRKSAEKVFEKSNKPYKCIICGYSKHVEIAHVKAVADFEDNVKVSEINNIDNLIALCPNHHWEYDNGLLKL